MAAIDILISNSGERPIYEQITGQIKGQILSGKLLPGEALPSIRMLARELRISVITTKRAYDDMERDGFITTVPGKGSFVAAKNTEFLREERLRLAEEHLAKAVDAAKSAGLSEKELTELLALLFKNEA